MLKHKSHYLPNKLNFTEFLFFNISLYTRSDVTAYKLIFPPIEQFNRQSSLNFDILAEFSRVGGNLFNI